jgi:hypothetical protein
VTATPTATSFPSRVPTVAPTVFTAGTINRFAGMYGSAVDSGDGGQAKSAGLWWPQDVCVDSVRGKVYIMTSHYNIMTIRLVVYCMSDYLTGPHLCLISC